MFIDTYSSRGLRSSAVSDQDIVGTTEVGPAIAGNVRTGSAWDAWEPRWAIGNLHGLYGYTSDTFGAAFGVPSGTWLKIDADNGLRMGYGALTRVEIDAAGNASFVGAVTATSGSFTGSITAGSGTIAGWTIGTSDISKNAVGLSSSGAGKIYVSNEVTPTYYSSATPFFVDGNGQFSLARKLWFNGTDLSIDTGNVKIDSSGIEIPLPALNFSSTSSYKFTGGSGTYAKPGQIKMETSGGVGVLCSTLSISAYGGVPFLCSDGVSVDGSTPGAGYVRASGYKVGANVVVGSRAPAIAAANGTLADLTTKFNTLLTYLSGTGSYHGLIG